jgi:leukotriene-A4 hydrolase
VRVCYATSATAEAAQWLRPEQTSGKTDPFLFTQCQAIHARSLLPCQDSPQTKCPYTASVTVEPRLVALMSAKLANKKIRTDSKHPLGITTFSFEQPIPIPSYLIALAVGRLEPRRVGPRSLVWAEPDIVDAAVCPPTLLRLSPRPPPPLSR